MPLYGLTSTPLFTIAPTPTSMARLQAGSSQPSATHKWISSSQQLEKTAIDRGVLNLRRGMVSDDMNCNPVAKFAIALLVSVTGILGFSSRVSAKGKEKVLYSFQGGSDGARPAGSVIFDRNGNLYGATTNGGSSSCRGPFQCGTVYQLKPPVKQGDPWTETVLYVFKGSDSNDGASPFGGLILDQAGTLYGTTGYDGTGNCMLFGGRVG